MGRYYKECRNNIFYISMVSIEEQLSRPVHFLENNYCTHKQD